MKLVLTLMAFAVAVSIACSTSRTASSSSPAATPNPDQALQSSATQVSSTGQEKHSCNLNLSQAPVLHGLKLGMTTTEVLDLFPGVKDDAALRPSISRPPSALGVSSFTLTPPKHASGEQFAGISHIAFNFLDSKVSNFQIGYNGPAYPHVDKFVEKLAGQNALPPVDQWEPYVGLDSMKILKCADFEVRVFAGGEGGNLNYVLVQDLEADKTLKERRRKAREHASPTPDEQ